MQIMSRITIPPARLKANSGQTLFQKKVIKQLKASCDKVKLLNAKVELLIPEQIRLANWQSSTKCSNPKT